MTTVQYIILLGALFSQKELSAGLDTKFRKIVACFG